MTTLSSPLLLLADGGSRQICATSVTHNDTSHISSHFCEKLEQEVVEESHFPQFNHPLYSHPDQAVGVAGAAKGHHNKNMFNILEKYGL